MADDDGFGFRRSDPMRKYQREVERLAKMVAMKRASLAARAASEGKATASITGAAKSEKARGGCKRDASAKSRRTARSDAQISTYADKTSSLDRYSDAYGVEVGDYGMQCGAISKYSALQVKSGQREGAVSRRSGSGQIKPKGDGEIKRRSERSMPESYLKHTSNVVYTDKVKQEKQPADKSTEDAAWRMRVLTKTEKPYPKKALPDVVGMRNKERIVRQHIIHQEMNSKSDNKPGYPEQREADCFNKKGAEAHDNGKPHSCNDTSTAARMKTTESTQLSNLSISSSHQRKQAASAGRITPFGGKSHSYVPEKKYNISIYQSRLQEQRERIARRTKVQEYESKVCLHCSGVYPNGRCHPSNYCRNYRGQVEQETGTRRQNRADSMENLIGRRHGGGYYYLGQTYMPSAPTCSSDNLTVENTTHIAKEEPEPPRRYNYLSSSSSSSSFDSSDESEDSDDSMYIKIDPFDEGSSQEHIIGFEDPEKVMCKVTVTKKALIPENINRIKLLIIDVDVLNKPRVIRPPSSCSSIYADSYTEETACLQLDDILCTPYNISDHHATAMGREKSLTLPRLTNAEGGASSAVTVGGHLVEPTIGRLRQFLNIDFHDTTISLQEAKMMKNMKDMYGIGKSKTTEPPKSGKTTYFGCPAILKYRLLMDACFCPTEPTKLLTLHTRAELDPTNLRAMLICLWNTEDPSAPTRILTCSGKLHRICFGPLSAGLAFSCMDDGIVAVWDLEEPDSMHSVCKVKKEDVILRYPTYSTPFGDDSAGHASPVLAIVALNPNASKTICLKKASAVSAASTPFQIATMEEAGIIIFWQVERVPTSVLSAGIDLWGNKNPSQTNQLVMTMNLRIALTREFPILMPISLGRLILRINHVHTDETASAFWTELLYRRLQQSKPSPQPQVHAGSSMGERSHVRCIEFSPFSSGYFLAGYEDGRVFLCHTERDKPIMYFPHPLGLQKPVTKVIWSPSRPVVFFVFFRNSLLSIYDLLESTCQPVQTLLMDGEPIFNMALSPDASCPCITCAQQHSCVLMGGAAGTMLMRDLDNSFTKQRGRREIDFLERLVKIP